MMDLSKASLGPNDIPIQDVSDDIIDSYRVKARLNRRSAEDEIRLVIERAAGLENGSTIEIVILDDRPGNSRE